MVNTLCILHHQWNDISILNRVCIGKESIIKLHFNIASGVAIVWYLIFAILIGYQVVIISWHRTHRLCYVSVYIHEIEVFTKLLVNINIYCCIASAIGTAHGCPDTALVRIVEFVVINVATKYECTYRVLIGEIGCCTFLIVWEGSVCIVARCNSERNRSQSYSIYIILEFHNTLNFEL